MLLSGVPGLQGELRDAGHEETPGGAVLVAARRHRRRPHVAQEVEVVERLARVGALELAHVEQHHASKVEPPHPRLGREQGRLQVSNSTFNI